MGIHINDYHKQNITKKHIAQKQEQGTGTRNAEGRRGKTNKTKKHAEQDEETKRAQNFKSKQQSFIERGKRQTNTQGGTEKKQNEGKKIKIGGEPQTKGA